MKISNIVLCAAVLIAVASTKFENELNDVNVGCISMVKAIGRG